MFKKKKNLKKGTTLLEMTIYLALFVVVSFLVYQFFNFLLVGRKFVVNTTTVDEIVNQTEDKIDEIIKRGNKVIIDPSCSTSSPYCVAIDLSSGSGCFGASSNCSATCVVQTYLGSNDVEKVVCGCSASGCLNCGCDDMATSTIEVAEGSTWAYSPADSVGINNYYHWAWSDNAGWLDFGNVIFNSKTGQLTGYASFINGFDQISLNCLTTNNCNKSNYKVYLGTDGQLHGYAWGSYTGWVSFNCQEGGSTQNNICSTSNYKITVDPKTGTWDGYAWSDNIGWISFNCLTGGPTANNICSTSDYKVQDSRTFEGSALINFKAINTNGTVSDVKWKFPYNIDRTATISSITPNTGVINNSNLTISSIAGTGFLSGAVVKLTKAGNLDLYPKTNFTFTSSIQLTNGVLDLTNKGVGAYDVWVINPDGSTGALKGGFTITGS